MARRKRPRGRGGRTAGSADESERNAVPTGTSPDQTATRDDPPGPAAPDGPGPSAGPPAGQDDPAEASPGRLTRFDPLSAYIRQVRKYPELTREEEQELTLKYKEFGDLEAARSLILANLSLVVKIALMFRRAVANALDLIQEGNLGLMQALDRFDPKVGVRFPTYAAWWVKAYILKYLLDNARMVRVGTTNARRKLIYNLQKEKARLDAMGFSTGPKLLAEHFGVSEQDVIDVQATIEGGDVALDAPVSEGENSASRVNLMPAEGESAEEQVTQAQLKQKLDEAIRAFGETLNERERTILERRLIAEDPETLQQIGDRFGVTREAVRQSEERLLKRLEAYLRSELGEDLLLQLRR